MYLSDIDSNDNNEDSNEAENAISDKPTPKQVHFPDNAKASSSKGPQKSRKYTSSSTAINSATNQYHSIQHTIQNDSLIPSATTTEF